MRKKLEGLALCVLAMLPAVTARTAEDSEPSATAEALPGHRLRMPSAAPFAPQTVRFSLAGSWFQQANFGGIQITGTQSHVSVGYTIRGDVAVALRWSATSHRGNALQPREIQSFGDLDLTGLYVLPVPTQHAPVLTGVAVRPGVRLLTNTDGFAGYPDTASPYLDVIGSGVAGPVRLGASVGYLLDRSDALLNDIPPGALLTPGQRSALGISESDNLHWAVGADVPLFDERLVPFFEYNGRAYFGDAAGDNPHLLGFGARTTWPLGGGRISVSAGVDLAVGGTTTTAHRPPEPHHRVLFSASFLTGPKAGAPRPVAPPPVVVPTPKAPPPAPKTPRLGRVRGIVRDAESGEPLSSTVIAFLGAGKNALLTDDFGRFRQGEFEPGEVRIRAQRKGYAPAVTEVTIETDQTTDIDIDLIPASTSRKIGTLSGVVKSRGGKALKGTLVFRAGSSSREIETDDQGRFRTDLPPGTYVVRVEASGHVAQTKSIRVTGGELTILNVLLAAR